MHLTGASRKERTSSGVSARCSATIAVAHSPGDLRQCAHLMQFPIVVVAACRLDRSVVHELSQHVDGGSVVGAALCAGMAECGGVDLGSSEWHRGPVRGDFARGERWKE